MNERMQYVKTMDRQLSEWEETIERLRQKLQGESADKRTQLSEQVDFLESAKSKLKTRVDSIRAFSEDRWKQMTISVDRAQHELETALKYLAETLED
jgi:TolA-binding protein